MLKNSRNINNIKRLYVLKITKTNMFDDFVVLYKKMNSYITQITVQLRLYYFEL